jgi:DNA-binding CsgD family transcriptional regulator
MKFKNSQEFTFLGYLHQTWFDHNETDEREMHAALQQFGQMAGPVAGLMPIFFVLDYSSRNYVVFTESVKFIFGISAREWLASGWSLTYELAQKDYFKVYNQKVFPSTVAALSKMPQTEHQNHIFSYNFQYRNREGRYIHTLQRSTYITSKGTGQPLYCLGMVMDISAHKRDSTVVQTIQRIDAVTHAPSIVETNYYYPFEEDCLLTRQELNVVKYMADGMSSKVIAFKLGLSENTIANHRKNMLRKTNTKNVAQLIAFVIRNGIS